jgi:hypothetical protein
MLPGTPTATFIELEITGTPTLPSFVEQSDASYLSRVNNISLWIVVSRFRRLT